jgi:hypothetical protein
MEILLCVEQKIPELHRCHSQDASAILEYREDFFKEKTMISQDARNDNAHIKQRSQ